jgi:hypothetical protein
MKSWTLIGALAAGCFGFAAAFTALPVRAGPPCQYCLDRYDRCLETASVPSDKAQCAAALRQRRLDHCP